MHICYFACYDSPYGGSSRTFVFAKEMVSMGHEVTIITSSFNHLMSKESKPLNKGFYIDESIDGVRVVSVFGLNYKEHDKTLLRLIHMFQYNFLAFFVGVLKIKKIDIVLGTTVPLFSGLLAFYFSLFKGSRFALEIRDIWPEELIDLGAIKKNSAFALVLRLIEKFLYKKSPVIISCLPNVLEHIRRAGSDSKVVFIPNPYDPSFYFKKYDGGKADHLRIMYLGGSGRAMRLNTLIESFLKLSLPNTTLHIVGPKQFVDEYFQGRNEKMPANIKVNGFVERSKIPSFIDQADVLVHPGNSTDQLKFGLNSNKILEYLSSGRLVVLAAKTSNDAVSLSGAGYLIPPEDASIMRSIFEKIYKLVPKERVLMGSKGPEFLHKNHKPNHLAKKLVASFQNL